MQTDRPVFLNPVGDVVDVLNPTFVPGLDKVFKFVPPLVIPLIKPEIPPVIPVVRPVNAFTLSLPVLNMFLNPNFRDFMA